MEGTRPTYDLRVVCEALGHDLGSPEFAPSDEDVDVRSILGKVCEGDVRHGRGRGL